MAKKPGGVAGKVEALVRPVVQALGLRLWDVRYEKEGADWYLKVFIDRDEPMDTDTCEAASRAIDPVLDEADLIPQSYCLEVGSPGLGRKLTRPEHFDTMRGKRIRAGLYKPDDQGRKEVAGVLLALRDDVVLLDVNGEETAVPLAAAGSFKSCDDEDLFA